MSVLIDKRFADNGAFSHYVLIDSETGLELLEQPCEDCMVDCLIYGEDACETIQAIKRTIPTENEVNK